SEVDLDDEQVLDLARNRAVSDIYEPGSVFKTLTTATALDLGLITPQTTYVDEGWVHVGGHTIRNWDFTGYGEVTMTEFLQRSLNTGSIWISQQIGPERFYEYVQRFGIGQPTHIELSGEAPGMLRRVDDSGWYPVDLATHSYGQGLVAAQHAAARDPDLDLAGGHLRVHLVGIPAHHFAFDLDDPLEARGLESLSRLRRGFRMNDRLNDAASIAHVEEDDAAVIAPAMDPSLDLCLPADLFGGQGSCLRSLHVRVRPVCLPAFAPVARRSDAGPRSPRSSHNQGCSSGRTFAATAAAKPSRGIVS
ncbi:MAG: hypothetical protein F4210_14825, partial [Holophagales bacterium]|nr:hypothetical protein [Holophagales bacterium]